MACIIKSKEITYFIYVFIILFVFPFIFKIY